MWRMLIFQDNYVADLAVAGVLPWLPLDHPLEFIMEAEYKGYYGKSI